MSKATQLSLTLQNEIGALARLCGDLADRGVNLLALSAPDSDAPASQVRLLVANRELAEHALSKAGYHFAVEDVFFIELKNRPGALAKTVERLARAGIDVKYLYVTAYTKAQKSAAVIAVGESDVVRAARLLG